MDQPMDDATGKVRAYLDLVDQYVIEIVKLNDVRRSCVATLMLVFAGIDGLGKLVHPDPSAKPGVRFKGFLARMGSKYAQHADRIWGFRNSLIHNALNTESFMSHTEMGKEHHLTEDGPDGHLFISTPVLCDDFEVAKQQVE